MVGIYKITSPSGKVYIGQSWNIDQRKNFYEQYKCKNQTKLYNSLIKHTWKLHSFESIHVLPEDITQSVLDEYESIYVDLYKSCGIQLLNLREPGSRGKHTDETRKKMSDYKKQDFVDNPKKYESFKKSIIGRVHTDKQRKNNSIKHSGSNNSNYGRTGDKHWHYGKTSPKKGIPLTDEQRNKVIDNTAHLMKPVLVFDKEYNLLYDIRSINYAAKTLGIDKNVIRKLCNGKIKKHKSYIFNWKAL